MLFVALVGRGGEDLEWDLDLNGDGGGRVSVMLF